MNQNDRAMDMCCRATTTSPFERITRGIEHGIRLAEAGREEEINMPNLSDQKGKIGYIILWLLGVPGSILILIFLLRGCT